MGISEMKKALRAFVLENYLFTDEESALNDDDSFLDTGILDSMGVLELLGFITDDLSITVETDEVTPSNLDSINKIITFIENKIKPTS